MDIDIAILVFLYVYCAYWTTGMVIEEIKLKKQHNDLKKWDKPIILNGYWTINGRRFPALTGKQKQQVINTIKNGK